MWKTWWGWVKRCLWRSGRYSVSMISKTVKRASSWAIRVYKGHHENPVSPSSFFFPLFFSRIFMMKCSSNCCQGQGLKKSFQFNTHDKENKVAVSGSGSKAKHLCSEITSYFCQCTFGWGSAGGLWAPVRTLQPLQMPIRDTRAAGAASLHIVSWSRDRARNADP